MVGNKEHFQAFVGPIRFGEPKIKIYSIEVIPLVGQNNRQRAVTALKVICPLLSLFSHKIIGQSIEKVEALSQNILGRE
jgi:hypothetical protein